MVKVHEVAPLLDERRKNEVNAQQIYRRGERRNHWAQWGQRYAFPIRVQEGLINGEEISVQEMSEQLLREKDPTYLTEVERLVVDHVRRVLSQTTGSFTLWDYGGAEASSMQVIARNLIPFIEERRLTCISTSLSSNFKSLVEREVDSKGEPLVHAFVGDIEDIKKQGILQLSDGVQIPLRNAVAVLSNNTVSHSHIPEDALAGLGSLLSKEGMLILGNKHKDPMYYVEGDSHCNGKYGQARRLGWMYGLSNLERTSGLSLLTVPSDNYNYLIFIAPYAPHITI